MDLEVTVIIPFYNAEENLGHCIEGLLQQSMKPKAIILVDNNSIDGSVAIAKGYAKSHPTLCTYIVEEKQGAAAARNRGVQEADTEIISFIDSDCIPEADWLHNSIGPFADLKVGAVAGAIAGMGSESLFDKFHTLFTLKSLPKSQLFKEFSLTKGGFPTANLHIRKEVFETINGFDESMSVFGEDYDLCARIYQAGCFIQYQSESIVHHKHRHSLQGTWRQSFQFGQGHPVLLKKHFARLVILELPRFQYSSQNLPARVWINFTSADKKLIALFLASLIWPMIGIVMGGYILYLCFDIGKRLESNQIRSTWSERFLMSLLLIIKSFAFTCGRVFGSLRAGTICF